MNALELLEDRTNRLVKFLEMSAPKDVIAQAVILVVEAAFVFEPDHLGKHFGKWLAEHSKSNIEELIGDENEDEN